MIKLEDVCYISSGGTPSRGKPQYYNGDIPWAKISDIESAKEGVLTETEEYITREGLQSIGNRIFPTGTLLFAMYGSIGKVAITGKAVSTNQAILGIRPKNDKQVHLPYLKVWFERNKQMLISQGRGVALQNLSATIIRNLKIPLPGLEDQIYIAKFLSKAEALVNQRKESLLLLDEFLKSTFLQLFGDILLKEKTKLSEVATVVSGLTKGKKYYDKKTSYVPYMRVANVQDGYLDLKEIKEIEATTEEIERYHLENGDLLLTEGGDPDKLGRGAVWKGAIKNCIYQNHIFRVRTDRRLIDPVFLSFLAGSSYGKKYFLNAAKQTTGIASINSTQLKAFPVIIPPLNLQARFTQIVERTEALKLQYRTSLNELENLYSSLSQRAFNGELHFKADVKVIPLQGNQRETDYFKKRKALACYIINQSLNDDKFGDTKFEKLLFLADYNAIKRNFGQTYYQKVAGPYDNTFTNTYYLQAQKSKLFNRKRGIGQTVFQAGTNHEKALTARDYFSDQELEQVDRLINIFKKSDYEKPEIIATLYAVWNNRIIRQQQITDELLKDDFLTWDPKKAKYESRLDAALAWMRKENIVPDGWGKLIEKPKSKRLRPKK